MRVFVSLAVLFALLAIGVVATEMGLKTVVVPRTAGDGSKDDCNNKNCPPGVGSTFWVHVLAITSQLTSIVARAVFVLSQLFAVIDFSSSFSK